MFGGGGMGQMSSHAHFKRGQMFEGAYVLYSKNIDMDFINNQKFDVKRQKSRVFAFSFLILNAGISTRILQRKPILSI